MTNEQFEMIFAANYFGPFLLTHLLLGKFIFKICTLETRLILITFFLNSKFTVDFLKRSQGRVVNVGSVLPSSTSLDCGNLKAEKFFHFSRFYESKLAMLIFTEELAKRTMNSGKSECWKSFAGNIIKIKFLISAIVNTRIIDCLLLLIGVVASFVNAGPTQTDLCQDISWLFLLFQSIYSGQGLKVHVWQFFIISNNN